MDLGFPKFFKRTSPTAVSAVGGSRWPHCCFSANREVGMHSKIFKDWMWTKKLPYASVIPKSREEIVWAEFHSCPSAEFLFPEITHRLTDWHVCNAW